LFQVFQDIFHLEFRELLFYRFQIAAVWAIIRITHIQNTDHLRGQFFAEQVIHYLVNGFVQYPFNRFKLNENIVGVPVVTEHFVNRLKLARTTFKLLFYFSFVFWDHLSW